MTLLMNGTFYSHMPLRFTGGNGMGGSGMTLECPSELLGGFPQAIPVGYQFNGLVPAQKDNWIGATTTPLGRATTEAQVYADGFAEGDANGSVTINAPLRRGLLRAAALAGSSVAALAPYSRGLMTGLLSIGSRPSADDAAEATVGKTIVGLGLSVGESLALIVRLLRNRQVTDPTTGEIRVYSDDDLSVLLAADLWKDADGTIAYDGSGADRRDRLT